jgi:high-affinity Fe2+/Pb2+ permease
VLEFQEAVVIASVVYHVYDVNWLISDLGSTGKLLTAVLGYDATPSLAETSGYVGYWVLIAFWMYRYAMASLFKKIAGSVRLA